MLVLVAYKLQAVTYLRVSWWFDCDALKQ